MKKKDLVQYLKEYDNDQDVMMLTGTADDYTTLEKIFNVGEVFVGKKRVIVLYSESNYEM